MQCKIKVIKDLTEIFPKYKPQVGKVYDAKYIPRSRQIYKGNFSHGNSEFCVVTILDKQIVLRSGEYELVAACNGERKGNG